MATTKKQEIKTRVIHVADLKADDANANRGTERGMDMLEHSLQTCGAGRSILVDRNGVVVAGNKSLEVAGQVGIEEVIVVPSDGRRLVAVQRTDLDLSDPASKARLLAVYDNRTAELNLDWIPDRIAELPEEERRKLWTEAELRALLGDTTGEGPAPQIDKAAELQAKWGTARGQVWEIGKHRLMCGDSAVDSPALFQGVKASLLATDPPYGVKYGDETGPDSAKRFAALANDRGSGTEFQKFLERVFLALVPYLADDAAWYLWHAQLTQGFFAAAAAATAQLNIHRQIVWVKNRFILGHGDYHWQHELCFYGWRQGHRARWFGERDQGTCWFIDRPQAADMHPTEKPVECFARAIRLSTKEGEILAEPFAGSGTQFVAAEQLGRICYGMEISEPYCAVILQRLADMNLEPKLVSGP